MTTLETLINAVVWLHLAAPVLMLVYWLGRGTGPQEGPTRKEKT
jgi:hypothetical protein